MLFPEWMILMSADPKFQARCPRRLAPIASIGLAGALLAMTFSQNGLAAMPDAFDTPTPVAQKVPATIELALQKKAAPAAQQVQAPACAADTLKAVLSTSDTSPVLVNCSLTLPKGATVKRQIVMEGAAASNAVLDCGGGAIDPRGGRTMVERMALLIRSKQSGSGWEPPSNVLVKNCTIMGRTRVYGLGMNGNDATVRVSSANKNHTIYTQAMAPKDIVFDNVVFQAAGRTPLYAGPGVTGLTLRSSRIEGHTNSVAIYLDAESAHSQITGNTFSISTRRREQIAIDGSAFNVISGNTFENISNGGIYLYQNCGEKGTFRHQKPQYNLISDNTFKYGPGKRKRPAVWLDSRAERQRSCLIEPGSTKESRGQRKDLVKFNKVVNNTVIGSPKRNEPFMNDDSTNTVSGNKID
jgi:parallel beta-helix repeat protein